jgi:hypothetical protein
MAQQIMKNSTPISVQVVVSEVETDIVIEPYGQAKAHPP